MQYEFDVSKLETAMQWEHYPRTSKYDATEAAELSLGPNVLWLAESLSQKMQWQPNMRVLDLGCGRALSSVFLAREFDLQVWAVDLWDTPTTNWELIRKYDCQDKVFPLHGDGLKLPFAKEFFDAAICLDSYHYFGTSDEYPGNHLFPFVKRGGNIGVASPAITGSMPSPLPEGLESWVYEARTIDWWRKHWEQAQGVEIEVAETLPNGREAWLRWDDAKLPDGMTPGDEMKLLQSDIGESLGFVQMVARKQ